MNSKVKTEPLACPSKDALQALLTKLPAGVEGLIYSVAEIAERGGGKRLEVFLDQRRHPAVSLLQPGLADSQGPALCFNIPGKPLAGSPISHWFVNNGYRNHFKY